MAKSYNLVTNQTINNLFKKSKYFRVNLGHSVTLEKNGERLISDKDHFSASYNYQYKTFIYSQGEIGNIRFYTDHGILEDKIAIYIDLEEFIFDYDNEYLREKGVDAYIGKLLKEVDEKNSERLGETSKQNDAQIKKDGVAEKLVKSPGSVTFADIEAYFRNKRL